MKRLFKKIIPSSCLLMAICYNTFSQNVQPLNLGDTRSFLSNISQQSTVAKARKAPLSLRVSEKESFSVKINYSTQTNGQYIVGEVVGKPDGSFFINAQTDKLEGNIILRKEKKAFKYYSDSKGNAYVKPISIDSLLCVEYAEIPVNAPTAPSGSAQQIGAAVANLQSFPGANGCVLLDFDGHYVSGTPWNNGNPINAAPSGMSDADILEHWEVVAEDFRPFSVNVTTNEAVFNSYPKNRRMRCIITPTNTAAPGAGGVAYIGSFNWNDDTPCWTFILSGKAGGEASSHEVGHTFGLGHDGRTNPAEGYYAGHGNWAPIMGVGYYRPISQWSKGEYANANNLEDDLAKIASSTYGVGYRADDHGNTTANSTPIQYDASGNVSSSSNYGIISTTTDIDFFSFNTAGGNIALNINTVSRHGNLDIIARLYNSSGALIGTFNPSGLNATITASVAAGTYFLSVDGTGAGNPSTDGYSDYASLGSYFISGTIPPASVSGVVIVYKHCNYEGYAAGFNIGDYTLAQMQSRGVLNDDISSLKVNPGYEIQLFENDNFTGASITITANNTCLVSNGWNDRASSFKVRTSGVTNLAGTYKLQNRHSSLFMDVAGNSSADAANIHQWTGNDCTCQQFEFTHLGNGTYRILAKNSGKSLDVDALSTSNGANVIQWPYWGGDNQQFIMQATGDGFYKIRAKHSGKLIEVSNYSSNPGGNVQQWEDVGQTSAHWRLIPVTPTTPAFTTLIQAENYNNMLGVQTEPTTDSGGGLNVGWIDNGDWMAYYNITFPASGSYRVEYRVASLSGGKLSLDLNAGTIQLGQLDVPATGGWQNWTTISHNVSINAGTYNLGIFAQQGGWNINWIRITQLSNAPLISMYSANDATSNMTATSPSVYSSNYNLAFNVYPNPVENELSLITDYNLNGAQLKIYDAMGNEIFHSINPPSTLDVRQLPTGMHTLIFIGANNDKIVKQFVKQ